MDDVRGHPWFQDMDWEALEAKESQPPFIPDMKQANFDVTHELDEFLMVEKPLTHTKRKANPDLDKMKPELRHLEEHFTVYDFSRSQRMSYYPHNQPITSLNSDPEVDPANAGHSRTGTLVPIVTIVEQSHTGLPLDGPSTLPIPRPSQS